RRHGRRRLQGLALYRFCPGGFRSDLFPQKSGYYTGFGVEPGAGGRFECRARSVDSKRKGIRYLRSLAECRVVADHESTLTKARLKKIEDGGRTIATAFRGLQRATARF